VRRWKLILPVLVAALTAVTGVAYAATGSTTAASRTATPAALGSNWYASAPYLMPLDNNPPSATDVMAATGQKAFQLAFILANGSSCSPAWDGTAPVSSDTTVAGVINSIRNAGGDVSVSTGGYNGTKLGQVCGSASATAAAYQQVISKYSLHAIDLDLEEPEYENSAAIANELGAAQILQQNNSGLYISITMPGTTSGTGWFGQQLLNEAKTLGFTPNNFSIMPFDGGFNGASSQTSALDQFHSLLESTFGWDSGTAFAHEGFSGMNGRSDSGEYFYQADFQTVLNYAESNHLARFTYWSVNRDRQCSPPDNNGSTSGVCSSVAQGAWDFTKYTAEFAGATPPTGNPTPTPTTASPTPPGGGTGSCSGVAAWSSTTAYNGTAEVTYNGHLWQAKWWTYNDVPGGPAGVWTDLGAC
jgi:chitinase